MAGKRRFIGPNGALFVPNVAEDTIRQHVRDGLWTAVEEPKPKPAPRLSPKKDDSDK